MSIEPESAAGSARPAGAHTPVSTGAGFADPAALGLAAFALTTFVLSFFNAGLIPRSAEGVVFGLAFFYGGLVQFAAGLWEFAKGNTFGATAFCSYSGFWMAFAFLARFTDLSGAGADAEKGVGLFLLAWGIFTVYMTIAAWRTNMAVFATFVVLTLTFFALCLGAFTGAEAMTKLGGWLGILTALLAWYASFAVVANSTFRRTLLPVWPR